MGNAPAPEGLKLVTAAEMRAVEAQAAAGGTPEPVLMDRAARAVAAAVEQELGKVRGKRILVLVGPGNNGGDGLWAAYYLHARGAAVSCYCWHRAGAPAAGRDDAPAAAARGAGIPLLDAGADSGYAWLTRLLSDAAAVVDALLGVGLTRPITGELAALLTQVQRSVTERRAQGRPLPVCAVDVPTGLDADTGALQGVALAADWTVTFGFAKLGLYQYPGAGLAGTIIIGDIGVTDLDKDLKTAVTDAAQVRGLLPARPADANKGTFGRLLIVAGSANYIGAGVLATTGALRSGVGLATLAVPVELLPIVATRLTESTFVPLPSDMGVLIERSVDPVFKTLAEREYTALLVGCGLGREKETQAFIRGLLLTNAETAHGRGGERAIGFGFAARRATENAGPGAEKEKEAKAGRALPSLVLDADALNLLSEIDGWTERLPHTSVLTPHPGEMARLRGTTVEEIQQDRAGVARAAAKEWNQVVVLKGAKTVIAAPDGRVQINPAATAALASAGTGDVLAGVIASLLAQGLAPFDAAVAGVWLHGRAGELCAERIGPVGVLASDVAAALPEALRELL
jgi:NAD(P)H-hydrate epimerase